MAKKGRSAGHPPAKAAAQRQAQLEQMRQQARRAERKRMLLIYGLAGLVLVGIGVAIAVAVLGKSSSAADARKVGYVATVTDAAKAAGCLGVTNEAQVSREHSSGNVTYQQEPPTSGAHDADPLPARTRFYPRASAPPPERAVHNLEHGYVVGWYDSQLPGQQVAALEAAASQAGERFIAVPWTRSVLPDGRHFVLTAWDRTQPCTTVSQTVIDGFVKTYADPTTGEDWPAPTAPEPGEGGGSDPGAPAAGPPDVSSPAASSPSGGRSP